MSPSDPDFDPVPSEARRLAALKALALLDSAPEAEFEALVNLAAQLADCPTALLTLIDSDRQWVKAAAGRAPVALPRDISVCDHTIRGDGLMEVADLRHDSRFAGSPLVAPADGLRFYAGMPIRVRDDEGRLQPIGALCVVDVAPRRLGAAGEQALRHLAHLAEALIAAREIARRATETAALSERQAAALLLKDRVWGQAERIAMVGSWRLHVADDRTEWSDGVYRIHGLPVGEKPTVRAALSFYPPHARAVLAAAIVRAIEAGEPFDLELDLRRADGGERRVRLIGEPEAAQGGAVAIVGVIQDVTDRHALEMTLRRSANTDVLTGLCNRAAFDRKLAAAIVDAQANGTPLALALMDLDGFKRVNDTLGHVAGDDVLRAVGRRLGAPWLAGCTVARIGGDEFAVIVDDPALAAAPDRLCRQLEEALIVPVAANGLTITCAGTVGVGLLPADCTGVRDFVHCVDTLLYAAKRRRVGERRGNDRRAA